MDKGAILGELDKAWARLKTNSKMEWPALERILVEICRSGCSESLQMALIREAIDAHTGRGYFMGRYARRPLPETK